MTLAERKAALETALGSGAARVKYPDGSEIEYYSLADLRRELALVDGEIAQASDTPPASVLRFVTSRGLGTGTGEDA